MVSPGVAGWKTIAESRRAGRVVSAGGRLTVSWAATTGAGLVVSARALSPATESRCPPILAPVFPTRPGSIVGGFTSAFGASASATVLVTPMRCMISLMATRAG